MSRTSLFILASGRVEILREGSDSSGERKKLADLTSPNWHFGEMGLLSRQAPWRHRHCA